MNDPSTQSASPLAAYRKKRDFKRTAEPAPRKPSPRGKASASTRFVIQKHAARRLHYDFRLEMAGVLKSWAVPKGIPTKQGEKRLAIHVEDHPISYANFEGTIPTGNYGAGAVMVWDQGTYSVSDGNPLQALKQGKLHLSLHGKKLKGEWTLVRSRQSTDGKESWLLLKTGGSHPPISNRRDDQSVLTRRSMKRITADANAEWIDTRPFETPGGGKQPAPGRDLNRLPLAKPGFIEPMKARLCDSPPLDPGWMFEIKFDGIRAIAVKDGKQVRLWSRTGKELTAKFPEVAAAVGRLSCARAVLDGEIVALEQSGRSSFQLLQLAHTPGQRPPIHLYAFDLPNLEGKDLAGLPLSQRKALLESLVSSGDDTIRFSASLPGGPSKLMRQVKRLGLEGLIAKRADSKYEPGRRSGMWQKLKATNAQEFVIGGYTHPKGTRPFFGAILVGYYEKGKLRFASKVGTGFDDRLLKSLHTVFQGLKRSTPPFVNIPQQRTRWGGLTAAEMRRCVWLDPKLVCHVRFSEWTRDDHLRQPVFLGMREDKPPSEVKRERPA